MLTCARLERRPKHHHLTGLLAGAVDCNLSSSSEDSSSSILLRATFSDSALAKRPQNRFRAILTVYLTPELPLEHSRAQCE